MKNEKTILIASSTLDLPTWGPVAANLTKRGYDVIAYKADEVARGDVTLDIQVNNDRGMEDLIY